MTHGSPNLGAPVPARRKPRELAGRLPTRHEGLVGPVFYHAVQFACRVVGILSIRMHVLGREHLTATGPLILASTHLSHLEPFVLSALIGRRIDWITRVEFFRFKPFRFFLWKVGAIPVDRTGVPISTVRITLDRLSRGRQIGICPEGGVATGDTSACRGGSIRHGVALLAYRSGAPVVPVVILGTHALNGVRPYLPFRRGQLWIAFGEPLYADRSLDRRSARAEMSRRLSQRYQMLYRHLLSTFELIDADVP